MADQLLAKNIYEWLLTLAGAKPGSDEDTVLFDNADFLGIIAFYDWIYMEMSIQNSVTKELLYYQQYEIQEKVACKQVISTFFHVLSRPNQRGTYGTVDKQTAIPGNLKVLISCTSGASSSWFARLLREKIAFTGLNIQVDATSVLDLEKRLPDYDLVLLTPQIANRYKELTKKYGDKLLKLQALDYATRNTDNVLHQISNWYYKSSRSSE